MTSVAQRVTLVAQRVTSEAHRMMPVVQRVMSVAQRVQPVAQLLKMYYSGIIPSSDFKSRNGPENIYCNREKQHKYLHGVVVTSLFSKPLSTRDLTLLPMGQQSEKWRKMYIKNCTS
jgi:hypothetical protein